MALRDDLKTIAAQFKVVEPTLEHNRQLFDIFEGDLLTYVRAALQAELSENAFKQLEPRIAPINVLRRVIDKLSKIYAKAPKREIVTQEGKPASEKDQKLVEFYASEMDFDVAMTAANEFFNLFKNCFIEPYLDNGKPSLRILPADRFFVYSTDPVNPLRPTHYTKIMGVMQDATGQKRVVLYTTTKDEFLAHDDKGEIITEIMSRPDIAALGGRNPIGALPGVYINRSRYDLIPKLDTDTLAMTKLLPVQISDLNYAAKFQSFSLLYGIDVDDEAIKFAPNGFLRFKTDPANPEAKPQIGSIKPEVDTDKVLSLIKAELSMWMQSRNIKPGAMGDISVENAASGIAKAIDEMDTSEDRQKQVAYFKAAEAELWDLILYRFHPMWSKVAGYPMRQAAAPRLKVLTHFAEQRPIVDSTKAITDQQTKISMRIQSRRGALQELYPDWDEEQIDAKLAEVDEELQVTVEVAADDSSESDQEDQGEMNAEDMPMKSDGGKAGKIPMGAEA